MPYITLDLLKKRAEHNDGCLRDLEELTLHQQDLERIGPILKDECRQLQILYLQNNLIGKIEHLSHMKKLWYLNMAINNITVIENLEGCESLKKLDLTLNFIGDLTSIQNLQANPNLTTLHLTGNPCADIAGYRYYVIDTLPQLEQLDSKDVTKSERIRAKQEAIPVRIEVDKQRRAVEAEAERKRIEREMIDRGEMEPPKRAVDDKGEQLYGNTPEDRLAAYLDMEEHINKGKEKEVNKFDELSKEMKFKTPTPEEEMAKYGRYLQRNQAGLKYTMEEVGPEVHLYVGVPKFISTPLIECDVNPTYIRITIKEKILQLVLPAEVCAEKASLSRGAVDGRLLVKMPIANYDLETAKWREELMKKSKEKEQKQEAPSLPEPKKKGFPNQQW